MCGALTSRVLPRLHHTHLATGCSVVNHDSSRVGRTFGSSPGMLDMRRLLCTTALAGSGTHGRTVFAGAARLCPGSFHTCGGLNRLTFTTNSTTGTRDCFGRTTSGGTDTPRMGTGLNLYRLIGNGITTTRACLNGTANTGTTNRTLNGLCVGRNRCSETIGSFNSTGAGDTTRTRVLTGSCGGTGTALSTVGGPSTVASCLVTVINTHAGGTSLMDDDVGDTVTGSPSVTRGTTGSHRFTGCTSTVGWCG